MSPPPWVADRNLTPELASALIKASFPAIDSDGLKHLGSGWEYDAFLTGDGWVVRFPRRKEYAGNFERVRRVHRLVSSVLPANQREQDDLLELAQMLATSHVSYR